MFMTDRPELIQSRSVEDFLKAVYTLQQDMDRVSTNALAEALGVKAPSVTDMARRLVEADLIDYQKYQGVRLTSDGQDIALKIVRRHRLIELYLVRELGYEIHEVHAEAENLEHAVSNRFVEAVALKLGNPDLDPHGDPIPAPDGTIVDRDLVPLAELPVNTSAMICRFISTNEEMLQHILDRGFELETVVTVLTRDPFDGPLTVCVGDEKRVIGHHVASCILVEVKE
jgi:DtxR family transcriptional regulator, Mn-dependent transcriptional regulator